jgi:acyl-coenzyme A synthetase/AMP-(fatty) acid ligase
VRKGDRVVVVLPKIPHWLFCMTALLRIGAAAVPSAEQLRAKDLLYRANHSGAVAVVAHSSNAAEFDAMRNDAKTVKTYLLAGGEREGWTGADALLAKAEPWDGEPTRADDLAYIVYTSGTTKDPKGVVHSVAYTFAKRMQAAIWFDVKRDDLVWCTAGTGWAKSIWNVLLGPWSRGSAVLLHEGGFDPEERFRLLEELQPAVLCQAPTEYRLMAKLDRLDRYDLASVRHMVSAGEPLNPEVIRAFQDAFGRTIHDGYGQTENTLLVGNYPGVEIRPGSMGRPAPGYDVRVIGPDGREAAAGEEGDIALRGDAPALFAGYWNAPEETKAVYRGEWYVTGDRAVRDDDGYLWFTGRADDVILSAAYRIGPFEVESALLEHPSVAESAVVGKPDPDRGQLVKAFVVLRAGHGADETLVRELQAHCKRVTAPYKYPREIEFVDSLPKTRSGKIRRVELRNLEEEQAARRS